MRSRLGFAVAAHLDPDVLIVDEVLAVGDAVFQKKCVSAMHDLRGGGRTVLFVSHNMAAVENLCSRGMWIAEGRIKLDGPMREVIEAYMGSFASADGASKALIAADARGGSGEIRFTRVEFRSTDGGLQTVTRCGKSLVIRLHYRAKEPIERPAFALRMYTELGTLVTDTGTWLHGLDIPLFPAGDGYLDLEIDSLNLVPGRCARPICWSPASRSSGSIPATPGMGGCTATTGVWPRRRTRSTRICAPLRRPTWRAAMPWCISPSYPTIRSDRTIPR